MKTPSLFIAATLLCPFLAAQEVRPRTFRDEAKAYVRHWEGCKTHIYYEDGIPTVGIGFNLTVHPYMARLVAQQGHLTSRQIEAFFDAEIDRATGDAEKVFPSFYRQPWKVRLILVDLCYQMGSAGVRRFVLFRQHIEARQYYEAANELKHSKWYKQSGRRAIEHVDALKEIAAQY